MEKYKKFKVKCKRLQRRKETNEKESKKINRKNDL